MEEIRIEKLNEQWAGIPHEKLLNQSFWDQLNSLQILEQLAPLELAKQHLLADIIDILEHLGKADNIPFNQLYYIVENCADRYYTKVIKTFVSIKRQFADRQLLLVNTVCCLKFLEEYSDRQAQIWKIFHKHHNILDDLEDLHLHFDDFKTSLETDFNHLKEVTSHNIQNIQMSLNLQQTYTLLHCALTSIISIVNYQNCKTDSVPLHVYEPRWYGADWSPQIWPWYRRDRPPSNIKKPDKVSIQGTLPTIPEVTEPEDDNRSTPGTNTAQPTCQETDWPDAIPMQIPRVSSSTAQPEEQGHNRHQAQHYTENYEIPEFEENSEEEQFADFDSFMAHHNTHRASEQIWQDYSSHLQDLDDDQYYAEIDRVDLSQSTPAAQDYQLANQQEAPWRSMEELKRIFGRGRGQARWEELHSHWPFGPRTRSLQSHIQHKIKKNQHLHQRYTTHC